MRSAGRLALSCSPERDTQMDTTAPPRTAIDQSLVARIVSGYVRKNQLSPAEMPTLINTVYQSLLALGQPAEPEPPTPAVQIRRSVTHNYVVCLECGWGGETLGRQIGGGDGLRAGENKTRG